MAEICLRQERTNKAKQKLLVTRLIIVVYGYDNSNNIAMTLISLHHFNIITNKNIEIHGYDRNIYHYIEIYWYVH